MSNCSSFAEFPGSNDLYYWGGCPAAPFHVPFKVTDLFSPYMEITPRLFASYYSKKTALRVLMTLELSFNCAGGFAFMFLFYVLILCGFKAGSRGH